MSKDKDLFYLLIKNIDKPLKFFKANESGSFCEKKGIWEDFFKTYNDLKELEDFMVDRKQNIPRYIDL